MCGAGAASNDGNSTPKTEVSSQGDHERYSQHVRQVMHAADWPWPEHVLLDESKQPRFVHTVEDFMHEMLAGDHLEKVVVFPGGLEALGQHRAICPDVANAMGFVDITTPPTAKTCFEVLENLAQAGALERLKGKVCYRESLEDSEDVAVAGRKNQCLVGKWEALQSECREECKQSVYLAEMRLLQSVPCDNDLRSRRKSTMATTMRERMYKIGMDVRSMPFWDDISEGFFCGGDGSSYDLHIDCIPSGNIGSIFAGHKLLALWGFGDASKAVMKSNGREHFARPLSQSQVSALEDASCVALAPPGSVYLFSGACAHTVWNVGFTAPRQNAAPEPSLVASSYEALVNLHTSSLKAVADTLSAVPDDESEDEDLEEFQVEVAEGARAIQRRLNRGEVQDSQLAADALAYLTMNIPRVREFLEPANDKCGSLPDAKRQKLDSGGGPDESVSLLPQELPAEA